MRATLEILKYPARTITRTKASTTATHDKDEQQHREQGPEEQSEQRAQDFTAKDYTIVRHGTASARGNLVSSPQ